MLQVTSKIWKFVRPPLSLLFWLAGVAGASKADWLRWFVMLMPWLTNPWVWVTAISIGVAMPIWDLASWFTNRRVRRKLLSIPDGHQTDAAKILSFVLNSSKWSEREVRRLNFREMVDARSEFRRAALDDGLRTTGRPLAGGLPILIIRNHWKDMDIDPETSAATYGVKAKSRRSYAPLDGFDELSAHTVDFERIWPSSTVFDRFFTRTYIGAKKTFYLLAPDAWFNRFYRGWRTLVRAAKLLRLFWRRRKRSQIRL